MKDTKERLSFLTIGLHWLIAITIISLLVVGMKYPELHRSIGSLILVFVVIRIIWRIKNGWPKPVMITNKIEPVIARITHWILIIGTLLLPISGLLISIAGGYGLSIFGFEVVPINTDPNNIYEVITLNEAMETIGHVSHTLISNIMILTIFLHVGGALKHHFIYKDKTLLRMTTIRSSHGGDKS